MAPALVFWVTALLVAASALPVCFRVFRRFPDGGAGLSLALGLAVTSYGYFILRTAGVLSHGQMGYLVAIALLALAGAFVAGRDSRFLATLRRSWRGTAAAALLFSAAYFGYAWVRSYEASIGGTEQPMDFLYLNAMLESDAYPPEDPWLAGERASYYYFGYLQAGVLTGASGVESAIGYNLSLAAVFGSAAAAVASVAAALARWALGRLRGNLPVFAGGTAVVLLLLLASLVGVFDFMAAHEQYNETVYSAFGVDHLLPCDPGQTEGCYSGPANPRTTAWYPTQFWFWWGATRLVPNTIIEFPVFSFVLGDLHPHVMSLPGMLLAVGLAAVIWRGQGRLSWRAHRRDPMAGVLVTLLFGALAFTNAWDVVTGSALLGLAVFARNLRASSPLRALEGMATYLVPAAFAAMVLYFPWLLDFSSQAGGVYAYVGAGTRPAHAFLQFGAPLAAAVLLAFALRRRDAPDVTGVAIQAGWLPLVPLACWCLLAVARGDWTKAVNERGVGGFVTLAILGGLLWALGTVAIVLHRRRHAAAAPAAIGTVAVFLLFAVELFFVRDIFFGGFPRQNTVFKFAYQAWTLLAVAGSVGLTVAVRGAVKRRPIPVVALTLVGVLVVGGLFYALGAVLNRTGGFGNSRTIDGLTALARNDPAEYALTRWIAENTQPGDVVLEASGRVWRGGADGPAIQDGGSDWSEGGRIAVRTGRPTPIGWDAHEAQWRGNSAWPEIRRRQDAVDGAYLSDSADAVRATLKEFDVSYVVVGRVERSRYPADYLTDFAAFMDVAFEVDGLRVYRLRETRTVPTS